MIRHGIKKEENENLEYSAEVKEFEMALEIQDNYERHSKMVTINPNDYNSWNYLKDQIKDNNSEEGIEEIKVQMKLTELAIQTDPKSYASWFHRYYLFRQWKVEWFKEHHLCNFLLKVDPRNFHCWNYCLKNNFEIKGDLHNFSSMHYKPFIERNLFIDPNDEGIWNTYEKRRNKKVKGIIRKYKEIFEIIFYESFIGVVELNNVVKTYEYPTKRAVIKTSDCKNPQKDKCYSKKDIQLYLNKKEYTVKQELEPDVLSEILLLDPMNAQALKKRLEYTNGEERVKTLSKLKKIDPLRKSYYMWLEDKEYKVYTFTL